MKPIRTQWLVIPQPRRQARIRLFCFPYAGGGISAFREWGELIPEFIELALVQLPGRESRFNEAAAQGVAELVNDLVNATMPFADLPYATFGHSLGTLISYEFALESIRRGRPPPVHMLMSGRGAPHTVRTRAQSHLLPDDEFIEALRQMQGTPEEILGDREMMRLLLPTLRADFALAGTYQRAQPELLPCGLSVYGGLADADVRREHLQEWQHYTNSPLTLRMFPGGHFFLHGSRYSLLQAIARDLHGLIDADARRANV